MKLKQTKCFPRLSVLCTASLLLLASPFPGATPAFSAQPLPKITYQGLHSRTFGDTDTLPATEQKPLVQESDEQAGGKQIGEKPSAGKAQRVDVALAKRLLKKGTEEAKAGKLEQARSLIEQSLEANPKDIAALNNLGLVLRKLGKYEEASRRYRQALAISPDYPLTHKNYGVLLEIMAVREYRKYCELVPDSAKRKKVEMKIQRLTR